MGQEARKPSGLQLIWEVWSRRRWLGILVFAACSCVTLTPVPFLPNIYRSTATVLVERQQVPEAFVKATVTSGLETRLQTISQEILSRSRLEGLITRFGLYPDLLKKAASLEAGVERMRGDIRLDLKGAVPSGRSGETIAFSLSYVGSDPQTVALVTNTLASFYIEENLKVRERQAAGTAEFLRVQLQEVKQRLDEQERRVSEFKKQHIGELPQQMQANLATLEGLSVQLRVNSENQTRAMERREVLVRQLAEANPFGPAGGPDATAARIARLRQELTQLQTNFSDKYPDVIRVRAELAGLERQLAEGKPEEKREEDDAASLTSPYVLQFKQALREAEAEMNSLKREEQRLRDAITVYRRRVEGTPQREQELEELFRDYDTTKGLYRSLLMRHDEAQLAENMEQRQKGEQFRILDPAIPSGPAAPNRIRLILMGLLVSLGLAVGAVALTEHLDTSFHSVDGLRAFTTVPVLVSIPRIVTEGDRRRGRRRFRMRAALAVLGLVLIVGASYLVTKGYVPVAGPLARSWLLRI